MENIINKEKIGNITFETDKLRIASSRSLYCDTFYFTDVFNEQQFKKFIKSVEATVRKSKEYNKYIELLRTEYECLNKDAVLSNISTLDADLEFHHYPVSLYNIVEILVNKHLIDNDNFTSFSISKEIMEYHFKNKIGLVSLSKLNHKLVHDGLLFINKNQIFGKYEDFLYENEKGVSIDIKSKLNTINEMSDSNVDVNIKGIL